MASFQEKLHGDFWIDHAVQVIESTYGDKVSLDYKDKDLLKYGASTQVQTTKTTLMTLPTGTFNETYVSANTITHFASNNASDTTTIVVEGHTIDGSGNFTFVTQEVTLAGQTKTALTTPLARSTRAYASGSDDLVGVIYVAEDVTFTAGVPQTATAVHLMIPAGENSSQKASTTVSNTDYWILTSFHAHYLEKANGFGDVILEIRNKDGVFREIDNCTVADGNTQGDFNFKPYVIVPKNADVRLRATVDTNGKAIGGSVQGVLARVMA